MTGIYSCSQDNEIEKSASNQEVISTKVEIREILNIETENAGTIADKIGTESNTVQKLVITGPINAVDVDTIRKLPQLIALDLKGATLCSSDETYSVKVNSSTTYECKLYDNEIGEHMFRETKLGEIILPDNLIAIGNDAFNGLNGTEYPFQSIEIPEGVTRIGESAFEECHYLESITLPSTLKSIEFRTFWRCWDLRNIDLGGVESIGQSAFEECSSLTSIELPDQLKTIGYRCFYNSGLTSITIPEGVTFETESIESKNASTFYNCRSLQTVTLPQNMTEIYIYMFQSCQSLSKINIPESVTKIGTGAFADCKSLQTISLPNGLTVIESKAFAGCSELKEITIPETLISIEESGFENCRSLTDIILPSGLRHIGRSAFSISGLKEITIPNVVEGMGPSCFYGCHSLETVIFSELSVTRIEQQTFDGCDKLSHVTLPQNLEFIGTRAFSNCSSLKHISLPETLEWIGSHAFWGSALSEIILPNNVYNIGNDAFGGTQITTITIPQNVTYVGDRVFDHCEKLTSIFWNTSLNTGSMLFGSYNVNCLLYLSDANVVVNDKNIHNIIINGVADEIIIYSTESDFAVPQEFKALKISYTRNFNYPTYPGKASGWRSISLPFNVTNIRHEDGRILAPFNANVANAKPFWLRRLTANGFENVTQIEAGIPYIIAMPNNEVYDAEYNINGNITFSAEDPYGITIPATDDMIQENGPKFQFVANYSHLPASATIYALNENTDGDIYAGSVFTRNTRAILPFESYVTNLSTSANAPAFFSIDGSTPRTRSAKPLGPIPSIDDM